MTTTDLVAEMLRRFHEEISLEIDKKITAAFKKHELKAHTPHFTTQPTLVHECVYSRAMNQPIPRLCINCGKPEKPRNKIEVKSRE